MKKIEILRVFRPRPLDSEEIEPRSNMAGVFAGIDLFWIVLGIDGIRRAPIEIRG